MSNKYVSSIFRKIFSPKPQILIANAMRTICKSARRKNTFFRPVLLQIARAVNSADLGQQSKKYGNSRICLIFSRFLSVAQKAEPLKSSASSLFTLPFSKFLWLYCYLFQLPDILYILLNRTVGGEFTRAGNIEHR